MLQIQLATLFILFYIMLLQFERCEFKNFILIDDSFFSKNLALIFTDCVFSNLTASKLFNYFSYIPIFTGILFEFISSNILIKNTEFSNLILEYELFEMAYCQMFSKNTTMFNVVSDISFLVMVMKGSYSLQNLAYVNCSNGFLSLKNSNLSIDSSSFNNSLISVVSFPFSLIMVSSNTDQNKINLNNSTFIGFSTLNNGSILNIDEVKANITIYDCAFIGNVANYDGGALYFYSSGNITIESCVFIENEADCGGAICYDDPVVSNHILYLQLISNSFQRNKAETSGGAIMLSYKIPLNFTPDDSIYEENIAGAYGDDCASEPFRMLYLGDVPVKKQYSINDWNDPPFITLRTASGIPINMVFSFVLVDYFYQTVNRTFVE